VGNGLLIAFLAEFTAQEVDDAVVSLALLIKLNSFLMYSSGNYIPRNVGNIAWREYTSWYVSGCFGINALTPK
jgi:hypothetical protein